MIDIESRFKEQYEEEQKIINLRKSYEDLLLAGISGAQNVYQASAQQAEQQASYDISGAYANYLKQQRNIAAQGRLESGYKEEVGDVLQQQYQSAYTQAKASQAQTTAKAYETYTKDVAKLEETEEAAQASITKALEERAKRASEFQQWTWKQMGITEPEKQLTSEIYDPSQGLYPVYTSTGELTEFGKDWLQKAWLQGVDVKGTTVKLEDLLDEKQKETYKDYRFEILKDIADVDLPKDEKGNYFLPDYNEEGGKIARLKTQGYIDKEIKKPSLDLHWSDYGWLDLGTSATNKIVNTAPGVEDYMKKLGITNEDLKQATGYSSAKDLLTATANMLEKAEDGYSFSEILNSSGFNEAFGKSMATTMLHTWKGFNQGNMQQLAKDTYDQLMTQLADISKKKYTTGA